MALSIMESIFNIQSRLHAEASERMNKLVLNRICPSLPQAFLFWMLLSSVAGANWTYQGNVTSVAMHLRVNTSRIVGTIDDNFLCATLDWWPSTKCNYGSCPWRHAGLDNLDLSNPLLEQAFTELAPFTVRVGGTLQDLVVYEIGESIASEPCLPFMFNTSALFSYTGGCLSMKRWDALNGFFVKTGASVAFGLNALYGRSKSLEYKVVEPWDSRNTASFIRYTRDQGYPVTSWELGNELLGNGIGKTVSADMYAADIKKLRNIVDDVYREDSRKPLVVAPDSFYDVGNTDIPRFLQASGSTVVDVITRHIYDLGAGVTEANVLINRILSHEVSDSEAAKYKSLQGVLKAHPGTVAWVGEAGGAYNSGHHGVTDAFIMAFWYLNHLGMASKYSNQAFCRQSFIGGHYGLLDTTLVPNPDFYGALLWRRLMGKRVFSVEDINGTNDVRAFAHCHRDKEGGLTLLLLNYSNTTIYNLDLSVISSSTNSELNPNETSQTQDRVVSGSKRLEYHISPANGTVTSQVILLNGEPLLLTPSGKIPKLLPRTRDSSNPVSLEALTYAYVVLPDASIPACALV